MTPPDASGSTQSPAPDDRSPPDGVSPREATGPADEGDNRPSRELRVLFLLHVLVWNAVLLLAALGALLIGFRGRWGLGTTAIAAAVILAAYGVYRWPDRA